MAKTIQEIRDSADTLSLQEIRSIIDRADQIYYNTGEHFIPDDLYDLLKKRLLVLDPNDERHSRVGAPVPADSIFEKVEHTRFMGSLGNSNTGKEFRTWYERTGSHPVVGSYKVDGSSIALYYKDGILQRAVSRGDGKIGQDITANAIRFSGVPTVLNQPITCAIRGEAVLTVENWKKIDPDMLKNPRNRGNGIIGRKDGSESEYIDFIAFDISTNTGSFDTEVGQLAFLQNLGFNVVPHRYCRNIDEAINYYNEVMTLRETLPYWIDGVVFKIDYLEVQQDLGIVSDHHPRGQIAFKFPSISGTSVLKRVVLTVGHTGAIIPNARIEPVEIGGTTVQNVLLNNFEDIERLGVAIGDTVEVVKAGDIIPKIMGVIKEGENRVPIERPDSCPVCGGGTGHLENQDGTQTAVLYCLNDDCPAKSMGKINKWIRELNILGIGKTILKAMISSGMVRDPADLYTLNHAELAELPVGNGVLGDSRAEAILSEIDGKKSLTIEQFMGSLGIRHLGKGRVRIVRELVPGEFDTIDDWLSDKLLKFADDAAIPNIAAEIQNGINQLVGLIHKLLANGVHVEAPPVDTGTSTSEKQYTFVLTGTLSKKRKEIQDDIERAGHLSGDRVTRGVDYLVAADPNSGSSKLKNARKLGVQVISEEQMWQILNG